MPCAASRHIFLFCCKFIFFNHNKRRKKFCTLFGGGGRGPERLLQEITNIFICIIYREQSINHKNSPQTVSAQPASNREGMRLGGGRCRTKKNRFKLIKNINFFYFILIHKK